LYLHIDKHWYSSGGAPGKHKIQGVGPGFIPEVLDTSVIDETVRVTTEEATLFAGLFLPRRLAKEELFNSLPEGSYSDPSSASSGREENKGKMIVTVLLATEHAAVIHKTLFPS